MVSFFSGNALWYLVKQSDVVTKVVLLLLFVMSIVCWAIFFYKLIILKVKIFQMKRFLARLKNVTTFEQLLLASENVSKTLPGYYVAESLTSIKRIAQESVSGKIDLTDGQWRFFQEHMDQVLDFLVQNEESYSSVLAVSSAISPLIGLFGTVWGLVHSFIRISEQQNADITTVAPGISEAFITTLAGLMVAIPSLVMYHYLASKVRGIERLLLVLHDKIINIMFPLLGL